MLYDVFDFIEVCSKCEAVRCSHACSAADAAGDECSMQPQQGLAATTPKLNCNHAGRARQQRQRWRWQWVSRTCAHPLLPGRVTLRHSGHRISDVEAGVAGSTDAGATLRQ